MPGSVNFHTRRRESDARPAGYQGKSIASITSALHPACLGKVYFTPANGGYPVFDPQKSTQQGTGVYMLTTRHFRKWQREFWIAAGGCGKDHVSILSATVPAFSEYCGDVSSLGARGAKTGTFVGGAFNRVGMKKRPWEGAWASFMAKVYFCKPRGQD